MIGAGPSTLLAGRIRIGGTGGFAWRTSFGPGLYAVILYYHGNLFGMSPLI